MRYVLTWTGGGSATTAPGATSFLVTRLVSATTYTVTVAAEDEAGNQSAGFSGSATTPVSFAVDVSPITFTGICANCHAWIWGNTVNVASSLCGGIRVLPGDPDNSVLFGALAKPSPGCPPDRMPRGGPYLTPAQLTTIRAWIVQGANDN
jgi:hypothetical protein